MMVSNLDYPRSLHVLLVFSWLRPEWIAAWSTAKPCIIVTVQGTTSALRNLNFGRNLVPQVFVSKRLSSRRTR